MLVRCLIGFAFGAAGAYLIVRALQFLGEDSPYFPPDETKREEEP